MIPEQQTPAEYSAAYAAVVSAAFTDEKSHAFAEKYLDELLANWRGVIERSGRIALLMVLLIALDFVLGSGKVAEVGLAGVKLDREGLKIVGKLIPPIVAFLWADLWLLGRSADVLREVHERLVGVWLPGKVAQAVLEPVRPEGVVLGFSAILTDSTVSGERRANSWLFWAGGVNLVAAFLGPVAFLIYAYVTLFAHFGVSDFLVWLGLGVTVANSIRVMAIWNID